MSLTNFTVTNAIAAGDLGPFAVSSTTGFPAVGTYGARQLMRVDGEMMLIDTVPASGLVKVLLRGYDGTVAAAHEALSVGTTSSAPGDFLDVPSGQTTNRAAFADDIVTIGVDTTFTAAGTAPTATTLPLPVRNTTYMCTKASALAITLISGVASQMGVRLRFQNCTANAHIITYAAGFRGDTTSSDTATAAAKVGPVFECQCGYTGLWGDVSSSTASGQGWVVA